VSFTSLLNSTARASPPAMRSITCIEVMPLGRRKEVLLAHVVAEVCSLRRGAG
jgi:hypothetical protein